MMTSDDDLSRNVGADRLAAECPDPALPATECGAGWGEGDDAKYHAARNRPWGRGGEAIADCGAGLRVAPRSGDGLLFYNMGVRPHDSCWASGLHSSKSASNNRADRGGTMRARSTRRPFTPAARWSVRDRSSR